MEGDPKFNASQNIPNVPYHRFAEMIGLKGIYVDDPEKLGSAWDEALAAKRPVVAGSQDRSGGPAVAAAHHARPGEEILTEPGERRLSHGRVVARRASSSARFCLTIRTSCVAARRWVHFLGPRFQEATVLKLGRKTLRSKLNVPRQPQSSRRGKDRRVTSLKPSRHNTSISRPSASSTRQPFVVGPGRSSWLSRAARRRVDRRCGHARSNRGKDGSRPTCFDACAQRGCRRLGRSPTYRSHCSAVRGLNL